MLPHVVSEMLKQLRQRGISLGVDDVQIFRMSLAQGFGLESRRSLRELCVALWAKSPGEVEVVRAAFASLALVDWDIDDPIAEVPFRTNVGASTPYGPGAAAASAPGPGARAAVPPARPPMASAQPARRDRLRPLPVSGEDDPTLVLIPRYPVNARAVAQVWRRLRRPVRRGPAVELDVAETVRRRARTGVVTPPVLVPQRRNSARLLLLIDSGGSMTPYEGFVDHVRRSIERAARLDHLSVRYFHDVPGHADRAVLTAADARQPHVDSVLGDIAPLRHGRIYRDPQLSRAEPLAEALSGADATCGVCVVSDAGAAHRRLDTMRLLDTVALLKALCAGNRTVAWLNPVAGLWERSTAALVARHVPMFPLTVAGMYAAVDVLRGRVRQVARPL